MSSPIQEEYRPQKLDDLVGNKSIIDTLRGFIRLGEIPMLIILAGPAGTGKTSAAFAFARDYYISKGIFDREGKQIRGTFPPIKVMRGTVSIEAVKTELFKFMQNIPPSEDVVKILIFDEAEGLSRAALLELRPLIERFSKTTAIIFTTNVEPETWLDHFDPQLKALRDRARIYHFEPITEDDIATRLKFIAGKRKIPVDINTLREIAQKAEGSVRQAIGSLFEEQARIIGAKPEARVPAPEELSIADPAEYGRFAQAIKSRLRSEVDTIQVDNALALVDRTFTASEAVHFIETTGDLQFSWIRGAFQRREEEFAGEGIVKELADMIRTARDQGVSDMELVRALKEAGIDIARPTSADLEKAKERIEQLEKELQEAKVTVVVKPSVTTPSPVSPQRVTPSAPALSEDQVDLLFNSYKTIIGKKMGRDLFPSEIQQFEELVLNIQKVKPKLSFSAARNQVDALARSIAAIGTEGRIIIRRGQQRLQELLDRMLSEPLTREEEEELARLRAGAVSMPEEEIQYEPPRIIIIADSGPMKVAYPFELGRYWNIRVAELNAENFKKKGFQVRVQSP